MTTAASGTTRTPTSAALPAAAPPELAAYVEARVISVDDVAAAAVLKGIASREPDPPEPDVRAWVAMCLALRASRDGHTCVFLDDLGSWAGDIDVGSHDHLDWPNDPGVWEASLATAGVLVGGPGSRAPFILHDHRLSLARSLHEEEEIARRLLGAGEGLEILLGGPGTGKTTLVAARLVDLLRDNPRLRIALAAPTGKAAARMAEALEQRLHDSNAPAEIRGASPAVREAIAAVHPVTIHKLLGVRPHGTPRYRFRAGNPLAYDLVVVDEASMLSSSLMHHLLAALGEKTRLLLVGDPNQLASVEAGSVLGDITKAARRRGSRLAARTTTLTERHRFGTRIGALADAILLGAPGLPQAFDILEGRLPGATTARGIPDDPASVRWVDPRSEGFPTLVELVVAHARRLRTLAEAGDVVAALELQRELQVLCAHREGATGVSGWNALVERRIGIGDVGTWYAGRPVLATANAPALGLHNGDVGLVVHAHEAHESRRMVAAFPGKNPPRLIPVARLEHVETVHALTIHKSQGSEYRHAIVVLPDRPGRILTAELLYTGVTRARARLTVVGPREVLAAAITTPIRRATGLAERLSQSDD